MSEPMDIANMLSLGVRQLHIWCVCGRQADLDLSGMDPSIVLLDLSRRLRCRECGQRPQTAMPDWTQHKPAGVAEDLLARIPG